MRPDWLTRTVRERFDEKWIPEPNTGCWLWTACTNYQGYGGFVLNGKRCHAQRVSWFLTHGVMPSSEIDVCHHCDTPSCVNPDHLFLGTRSDNMRDAITKGRKIYTTGYGKRWSKLRSINNPKPKSICIRGHILNEDNIYVNPIGHVSCRECRRLAQRKFRGVINGMAITASK